MKRATTVASVFFCLIALTGFTGIFFNGQAHAAAPAVASVPAGEDEGMVDTDWFRKMITNIPQNVAILDLRSPEEFAGGHVEGAINLPAEIMYNEGGCQKTIAQLPKDKFVIFHCMGGSKSGGVYFELKEKCTYPGIDKMFYLGAEISFKDGKVLIEE
jgi:hydroxyacylglutathione hydrolase